MGSRSVGQMGNGPLDFGVSALGGLPVGHPTAPALLPGLRGRSSDLAQLGPGGPKLDPLCCSTAPWKINEGEMGHREPAISLLRYSN